MNFSLPLFLLLFHYSAQNDTCGLGSYPALFDTFAYDVRTYSGTPNPFTFGELFGINEWWMCNPDQNAEHDQVAQRSRGWYHYNHGDVGLNPSGSIYVSPDHSIRFKMDVGYDPTPPYTNHPKIESGFHTKYGTYAARIKFSKLDPQARLMQAFWMQGAHDLSNREAELDFEWNNWFDDVPTSKMHVTNHTSGNGQSGGALGCVYWKQSLQGYPECLDTSGSFVIGESGPGKMEEEWWTLVVRFQPEKPVMYAMFAESYGGIPGTVWAGQNDANALKNSPEHFWWHPFTIDEAKPTTELVACLGISFANDPRLFFRHGAKRLSVASEMWVDWFYYTPADLTPLDVRKEVIRLIATGRPRINTTGKPFE